VIRSSATLRDDREALLGLLIIQSRDACELARLVVAGELADLVPSRPGRSSRLVARSPPADQEIKRRALIPAFGAVGLLRGTFVMGRGYGSEVDRLVGRNAPGFGVKRPFLGDAWRQPLSRHRQTPSSNGLRSSLPV